MSLLFSLAAAGAYTAGAILMKQSAGLTKPLPATLLFVCFLIGAALQALSMRVTEMSRGILIILGVEAALAVGLGSVLFGEQITTGKIIGVALVVIGVGFLRRQ